MKLYTWKSIRDDGHVFVYAWKPGDEQAVLKTAMQQVDDPESPFSIEEFDDIANYVWSIEQLRDSFNKSWKGPK